MRRHPEVALRTCDDCEKFWYDAETGEVRRDRLGLPILRPSYVKTPCLTCPKIPEAVKRNNDPQQLTRAHAVEWTESSRAVYAHWQECRAVGDWPRDEGGAVDPLVRRHAALLSELERHLDRADEAGHLDDFLTLLTATKRR